MNRPIHFFGSIGFVSMFISLVCAVWAVILKIQGLSFIQTPLPVISAMFVIVGVQMIVMGVMAEILMRTYYESQNKKTYIIKETINI
jgi:hypothetical protein